MNKQAIVITANNEVSVQQIPSAIEYDFFSTTLGGMIQAVDLAENLEGLTLWVNENGKNARLPLNALATYLWNLSYGFTDIIVGTAIITGGADRNGDTVGLSDSEVAMLMKFLITE